MNSNLAAEFAAHQLPHFVGIRFVETFSGYSKASVMRRISRGEFPRPCIKESTTVRWDYADLLKWRESKLASREKVAA